MVLVHVCFIYNTAIFFHFDEISENSWAEARELTELYNNSNGKLALKHTVPFPTENDDCRIPSPCSRTMTMIFNLFSANKTFPPEKYPEKYIGRIIILSHFTFHLVWSTQRISIFFQHTQKHIRFTVQSVLVNRMLTPEWRNRIFFSIFICFGVGARETRLSDNMTLG